MAPHNPNNWHWINAECAPTAKQWFQDNLPGISAEEDGVTAKISKVVSMDGDADVTQRKGKVFCVYDLKLVLEYSGSTVDEEEVSGTITIPEVANDTTEDEFVFEIDVHGDSKTKQPVKALVRSKLVPQLRQEMLKLSPALIEKHGKEVGHASGSSTPTVKPAVSSSSSVAVAATKATQSAAPTASPTSSSKAAYNKQGTINTTTVTDSTDFRTTADQLYQTFTDPQRIAAFTRAPPKLFEGAKKGGKFEIFGDNVSGEFAELHEPTKIVQSWRLKQWPEGHFSRQEIEFDQNNVDGVTVMRVNWTGVPVGQEEVTKQNWNEYYVRSIKITFGFGTVL